APRPSGSRRRGSRTPRGYLPASGRSTDRQGRVSVRGGGRRGRAPLRSALKGAVARGSDDELRCADDCGHDVRGDGLRRLSFQLPGSALFMRRFVRLDGGAAGAELLRLAARVFELGACVGVDEQAGLDSLEAVTL